MAIKNYTSNVDPLISLGEIQAALAKAGAGKVMIDYADGKPISVSYTMQGLHGPMGFKLPAPVDGTIV